MKRKKVALYNPYLDVLGGGEKHILSILKVLEDNGYEINIFWDDDLSNAFKNRLNISFQRRINFLPNIFNSKSQLTKLLALSKYDKFFYITDGSYFFSTARNNYVFSMVPNPSLYKMSFINKLKTINYQFIANSKFTQKNLLNFGIQSKFIYPYIDDDLINIDVQTIKKEPIILTVGRFFSQLHSKKQDLIIKFFINLKKSKPLYKDFKLILAGGLKEEDQDYYNNLKKIAGNDPNIIFATNINYEHLLDLYKKAFIYWHITGFGVDEEKNPELTEHLGITPLEAMAAGCITFVYNAGGIKEIVKDNETGLTFLTEKELIDKMMRVSQNEMMQVKIKNNAKRFIKENFSYDIFKNKVMKILI